MCVLLTLDTTNSLAAEDLSGILFITSYLKRKRYNSKYEPYFPLRFLEKKGVKVFALVGKVAKVSFRSKLMADKHNIDLM